jgi:hypothetical protein
MASSAAPGMPTHPEGQVAVAPSEP